MPDGLFERDRVSTDQLCCGPLCLASTSLTLTAARSLSSTADAIHDPRTARASRRVLFRYLHGEESTSVCSIRCSGAQWICRSVRVGIARNAHLWVVPKTWELDVPRIRHPGTDAATASQTAGQPSGPVCSGPPKTEPARQLIPTLLWSPQSAADLTWIGVVDARTTGYSGHETGERVGFVGGGACQG